MRICLVSIMIVGLSVGASHVNAYSKYHSPAEATQGCVQCHNGFVGRGALHATHEAMRTGSCLICHASAGGDDPFTYTSGGSGGLNQGCRGCHGVNNGSTYGWATGLRLHHKNAGAPADSDGKHCYDCHTSDPAPSSETTLPVYYTNSVMKVKNPCMASPAPPGEDFDGDGKGLDNNGNLIYDENEYDCGFRITAIKREGNDMRVSWQCVVGRTNYLQTTSGNAGSYVTNSYADLGSAIVITSTVPVAVVNTNGLDTGGATNFPARYYRIRRPSP